MDLHGERRQSWIRREHKLVWREDVKLSGDKSSNLLGHHTMVLKGLANMILLQKLGGSALGCK